MELAGERRIDDVHVTVSIAVSRDLDLDPLGSDAEGLEVEPLDPACAVSVEVEG